jgi:transcriptional regulator with PAS, ATPase and Fis domain
VRELENIIAAGVLQETNNILTLTSTPGLSSYSGPERRKTIELLTLEEIEKRHIERVLEITAGNRPKAAEILGINVSTVYRKIEKYKID